MDPVQDELFGSFPRRLGTPSQFWAFSASWFDAFVEKVSGVRNAYATISRLPVGQQPEVDKVLFDLDGDKSALPDTDVDEQIALMRSDPDLADAVLGDVVDEARKLSERSSHDGIPAMGVFTGFGIHVHQLYQPTQDDPKPKLGSTARRYRDLLDLETADEAVDGDVQRICRVPNVERTTLEMNEYETKVLDGRPTGLYQIPLTAAEMQSLTVQGLLEMSTSPREIPVPSTERPVMGVFEDYTEESDYASERDPRELEDRSEADDAVAADVSLLLEELLEMPCMVTRLQQPNPSHKIRLNGAVMLFNCGLSPTEVHDVFRRLHWTDFDSRKTKKYLKQIYKSGYSDMTCKTLRTKGFCVVDDHFECPTYGWSGGRCEWK